MHTPNFNLHDFFELKRGIDKIARNKKTKHYNYADLAAITEALEPHLGTRWEFQDYIEKLDVVTRLYDLESAGLEYIEQRTTMPVDLDPQDTGKAETYFRRYHRVVLLSLQTEDNDAAGTRRASTNTSRRRSRRNTEEGATY